MIQRNVLNTHIIAVTCLENFLTASEVKIFRQKRQNERIVEVEIDSFWRLFYQNRENATFPSIKNLYDVA